MDSDPVAVVMPRSLRFPQAHGHDSRSTQVNDALAALTEDLACPHVAERLQQRAIEREATLQIGDDEIEVINASSAHRRDATRSRPSESQKNVARRGW